MIYSTPEELCLEKFNLVFIALTVQVATQVKFRGSSKTEVVNKIIRISSSQSVP